MSTTAYDTTCIRILNDEMRMKMSGEVILTCGVSALAPEKQHAIIKAVREFNDFKEANDPYKEHDFGAVDVAGERVFWKIDYYNADMDGGSEDPADDAATKRVLTIMLAEEY